MTRLTHLAIAVFVSFTAPAAAARASGAQVFDAGMKPILASYLEIQAMLAADHSEGVTKLARRIAKDAAKLDARGVEGEHAAHYQGLPGKLKAAAEALATAQGIDRAREKFKALSRPMAMWGTMSKPTGIAVVFCSMAKGSWLQKKGEIQNPYYGASMLTCGEVVGGDTGGGHAHGDRGGH